MSLQNPILGIDLGTTHSLVAVFSAGEPILLPNAFGQNLTPSIVGRMDDGRLVVGAAARELRLQRPGKCAWGFKRWMGTDRSQDLGDGPLNASELSAIVLSSLKQDAERALGISTNRAVISVPAYFNEHQRRATRLAGELAGLEVLRIVNEPTAAALAYGFGDPDQDSKILVVDLGGGTFDVTLMEIFEGSLEIVATAGESRLGGEDFTEAILDWALRQEGWNVGELEPRRLAALRAECEHAKRRLNEGVVEVRYPDEAGNFGPDAPRRRLDEIDFREETATLIDRLIAPIGRVMRDAGVDREEIDEVLLVGGATRMNVLREKVNEMIGREPRTKIHPDECVALGAAVQAALIAENAAVEDLVVTDVAPFTLGVEVSKEFRDEYQSGFYLPIIHRNTTVPTAREQSLSTLRDDQEQVQINVYQGEARKVERNHYLGTLQVLRLPPSPAGLEVRVRFAYDVNGVLDVRATVPSTGERFETVIVHPQATLSQEKIARSVERLRKMMLLPTDDAESWLLLSFAERMIEEVGIAERERLEAIVDFYENALRGHDLDQFEEARRVLRETLEALGLFSNLGSVESDTMVN